MEEPIYDVEDIRSFILDKDGRLLYLYIKWEGYDESTNTWEPLENIFCKELLESKMNELRTQHIPLWFYLSSDKQEWKPISYSSTIEDAFRSFCTSGMDAFASEPEIQIGIDTTGIPIYISFLKMTLKRDNIVFHLKRESKPC